MSDRRSVTPTPNTALSHPTSTLPSSPILSSLSLHSREQVPQHSSESPQLPLDQTIAGPSSPKAASLARRASDDIALPRPAKRMRRDSHSGESEGDGDHSSPSEASSQSTTKKPEGDLAGSSGPSASPSSAPPPKKKRTRTLTTPHQSAVLHALLKQSRFPSTAVRESVGQSIGLSARKVQIWFQNQRQKARRPRPDKSASTGSQPPATDPSQVASASTHQRHHSGAGMSHEALKMGVGSYGLDYPYRTHGLSASMGTERRRGRAYSEASAPNTFASSPQLLGPGMPGGAGSGRATSGGSLPPPSPPTHFSPRAPPTGALALNTEARGRPVLSPATRLLSPQPAVSSEARRASPDRHERELSVELPPILYTEPETMSAPEFGSSRHVLQSRPYSTSSIPSFDSAPWHRHAPYTHSPSSTVSQPPSSASSIVIPPPFTLQPQPMWDSTMTHSPLQRSTVPPPTSARPHWDLRPPSSHVGRRELPALESRIPSPEVTRFERPKDSSGAPVPPKRYDPVRSLT